MKQKWKYYLTAVLILVIIAGLIRPMIPTPSPSGQVQPDPSQQVQPEESEEVIKESIPYWTEDSAVMKSIMDFVKQVSDPASEAYVEKEDRIAVFDFDGTLYGELFPTYFDTSLMIHRALHDESYEAPAEIKEYAEALEYAFDNGLEEPDSPLSGAQCQAEMFKDFTIEQYRDYVRSFMKTEVKGFNGMTYEEGFYIPMVSLVEYLDANDFTVFISSGSERNIVRELIEGVLDEYIPSDRVIGSTFTLKATGQGDKAGKSYNYKPEDEIVMEGNLVTKNQKTNKIFSIIDEIGNAPLMVFGNSSGDLAMGEYALQHGGRGYMLLCDDTERDYGKLETAEKFKADCEEYGFETVSMKDDFKTIYKEGFEKAD